MDDLSKDPGLSEAATAIEGSCAVEMRDTSRHPPARVLIDQFKGWV
jgi:hypothetical protein